MAWSFGQQGDAPKPKKKRLSVSRASTQSDANAGSAKPYVNTQRGQAYRWKSLAGQGGTLKGGKSPGYSGRSGDLQDKRASVQNDKIASGKMPLLPNNTISRKEHDTPGKAPYTTDAQRADFEKRTADFYANKLKQARRKASRKNLGKHYNNSTTEPSIRYRGNQNA